MQLFQQLCGLYLLRLELYSVDYLRFSLQVCPMGTQADAVACECPT